MLVKIKTNDNISEYKILAVCEEIAALWQEEGFPDLPECMDIIEYQNAKCYTFSDIDMFYCLDIYADPDSNLHEKWFADGLEVTPL